MTDRPTASASSLGHNWVRDPLNPYEMWGCVSVLYLCSPSFTALTHDDNHCYSRKPTCAWGWERVGIGSRLTDTLRATSRSSVHGQHERGNSLVSRLLLRGRDCGRRRSCPDLWHYRPRWHEPQNPTARFAGVPTLLRTRRHLNASQVRWESSCWVVGRRMCATAESDC